MKIGFIGGGNIAEALIKGIVQSEMRDILVSEPKEERRKHLRQNYKVEIINSNTKLASLSNIIILAVKPQSMEEVLDEITEAISEEKTVVSIAAGITLTYLTSKLKTKKLIRVMPNTPALVHEGMTVMSLCECFSDKDIAIVMEIFKSIGKVFTLPEKYMDAVTALSGSGPAFFAFFIEAMAEGGIMMGLNKDDSLALAIQTALGTCKLLDSGMSPLTLREAVTSQGGTTEAGLKVFHEKGFKDIVISAIEAATQRAKKLGIDPEVSGRLGSKEA